MKRNIIRLILNAFLFVLWSIVGIGKAITEPSWMCLVYGGIVTLYLVITISGVRYVIKLTKIKNAMKEKKMKKN